MNDDASMKQTEPVRTSIAMATFNGGRHVLEQLRSFVAQTRLPDELVVCDDASTDDTARLVTEFARSAPFPVRLFVNEKNLGFTQNFAKAMSHCSGDLVFLSDQDDVWFDNKIEVMVHLFDRSPDCWIAVHDGQITDEDLNPTTVSKLGQIRSGYGTVQVVTTGALTVARKEFLSLALPVPKLVRGHDTWLHALAKAFPTRRLVVEGCLQYIRRHERNTSEWVVNRNRRINRIDVFWSQLMSPPATSYRDQILLNEELQRRLSSVAHIFGNSCPDSVAQELTVLRKQLVALERRQQLATTDRARRVKISFEMLARGQYASFNGFRSFLRDLLR